MDSVNLVLTDNFIFASEDEAASFRTYDIPSFMFSQTGRKGTVIHLGGLRQAHVYALGSIAGISDDESLDTQLYYVVLERPIRKASEYLFKVRNLPNGDVSLSTRHCMYDRVCEKIDERLSNVDGFYPYWVDADFKIKNSGDLMIREIVERFFNG